MIARIKLILKIKNISPTHFADTIKVQRSGISHILSGRNKPSLDFVMKILTSYPEINSDWLLFGKGEMSQTLKSKKKQESLFPETKNAGSDQLSNHEEPDDYKTKTSPIKDKSGRNKNGIDRIIVFFEDKSFQEYSPR